MSDLPAQYQSIPLTWLSGSERELRRLTHAICITEPKLFDNSQPVQVIYRAALPDRRGGLTKIFQAGGHINSGRLTSLCDLAFRLNKFTGLDWIKMQVIASYSRNGVTYRDHYQKKIGRLIVNVGVPSMHERADAYLTLLTWLSERLHDKEKFNRLMGIEMK